MHWSAANPTGRNISGYNAGDVDISSCAVLGRWGALLARMVWAVAVQNEIGSGHPLSQKVFYFYFCSSSAVKPYLSRPAKR